MQMWLDIVIVSNPSNSVSKQFQNYKKNSTACVVVPYGAMLYGSQRES